MSSRNRQQYRVDPAENRVRSAPGKKNRRKWCRGKEGIEHQLAIRDRRVDDWWKDKIPTGCGYPPWRPVRRRWICNEEEYCTQCGKILQWTLGDRCTRRT